MPIERWLPVNLSKNKLILKRLKDGFSSYNFLHIQITSKSVFPWQLIVNWLKLFNCSSLKSVSKIYPLVRTSSSVVCKIDVTFWNFVDRKKQTNTQILMTFILWNNTTFFNGDCNLLIVWIFVLFTVKMNSLLRNSVLWLYIEWWTHKNEFA